MTITIYNCLFYFVVVVVVVVVFSLFFKLSSMYSYIPGHLPSSSTRIKLCPCQSLTFDFHLEQLSFPCRNK